MANFCMIFVWHEDDCKMRNERWNTKYEGMWLLMSAMTDVEAFSYNFEDGLEPWSCGQVQLVAHITITWLDIWKYDRNFRRRIMIVKSYHSYILTTKAIMKRWLHGTLGGNLLSSQLGHAMMSWFCCQKLFCLQMLLLIVRVMKEHFMFGFVICGFRQPMNPNTQWLDLCTWLQLLNVKPMT